MLSKYMISFCFGLITFQITREIKYEPTRIHYNSPGHNQNSPGSYLESNIIMKKTTRKQAVYCTYSFNRVVFYGFIYTDCRLFVFTYLSYFMKIQEEESISYLQNLMFVSYYVHQPAQVRYYKK